MDEIRKDIISFQETLETILLDDLKLLKFSQRGTIYGVSDSAIKWKRAHKYDGKKKTEKCDTFFEFDVEHVNSNLDDYPLMRKFICEQLEVLYKEKPRQTEYFQNLYNDEEEESVNEDDSFERMLRGDGTSDEQAVEQTTT